MFGGAIEHTPEMCAILDYSSILGLIGGVLGEDFNYGEGMATTIVEIRAGIMMKIGGNFLLLRPLSI